MSTDDVEGVWHDGVMCHLTELRYDWRTRVGTLFLPIRNSPDMSGAIRLFEAIDSAVVAIQVVGGDKIDVRYEREGGRWAAGYLAGHTP